MELNERQKKLITDGRNYLVKNDLKGFYEYALNSSLSNIDDIMIVSEFLDEHGIIFERYLDALPPFFCYCPKRWKTSEKMGMTKMTIPPQIKKLDKCCLDEVDIEYLDARNVEEIDTKAFSHSSIAYLDLEKIKKCSIDAFLNSEIVELRMDENTDHNIAMQIAAAANKAGLNL